MPTNARTRNWDIVFYPESAPENFKEIFDSFHIEYAISPLHDLDVNPDGEVKKAHYHAVLCFPSVKTFDQVKSIIEPLNCPIPQKCNSLRGSIEYFTHKNNPEKHQYSNSDIVIGGGLDIDNVMKATATERYVIIAEMMTFVSDNDIIEIKELLDFSLMNKPEWFKVLCDSGIMVMQAYIKSNRHRQRTADIE